MAARSPATGFDLHHHRPDPPTAARPRLDPAVPAFSSSGSGPPHPPAPCLAFGPTSSASPWSSPAVARSGRPVLRIRPAASSPTRFGRPQPPATLRHAPEGCAYVVFASAVAALQACFVALTGVEPLQWSRLCNIYTRFCVQGAFGMVSGLAAAVGMAVLSVFSARDLFRLYSPAGRRQAGLRSETNQTSLIMSSKNEMARGSAGDD